MNVKELIGTDECEFCGSPITMLDVEHGEVAEFFDPKQPEINVEKHKIGHYTCGESRGWELA